MPFNQPLLLFSRAVPTELLSKVTDEVAIKAFAQVPLTQGAKVCDALKDMVSKDSVAFMHNQAGHVIALSVNPNSTAKLPAEWDKVDRLFFKARLWCDEQWHKAQPLLEQVFGRFVDKKGLLPWAQSSQNTMATLAVQHQPDGTLLAAIHQAPHISYQQGNTQVIQDALTATDLPVTEKQLPKPMRHYLKHGHGFDTNSSASDPTLWEMIKEALVDPMTWLPVLF